MGWDLGKKVLMTTQSEGVYELSVKLTAGELKFAKENNIKIVGLHEHTGSGISDTGKVFQSMENLLNIVNPTDFPDLEFVDFGGGFKARYSPDEKEIDYVEFGKKAVEMFSQTCEKYGKKLKLYFACK